MLKDEVKKMLYAVPGLRLTRADLARHTGSTDRQVREAITELRNEGTPVCAAREGGYYIGTREEYGKTVIKGYWSRIKAYQETIQAFNKIMPLEGQTEVRP